MAETRRKPSLVRGVVAGLCAAAAVCVVLLLMVVKNEKEREANAFLRVTSTVVKYESKNESGNPRLPEGFATKDFWANQNLRAASPTDFADDQLDASGTLAQLKSLMHDDIVATLDDAGFKKVRLVRNGQAKMARASIKSAAKGLSLNEAANWKDKLTRIRKVVPDAIDEYIPRESTEKYNGKARLLAALKKRAELQRKSLEDWTAVLEEFVTRVEKGYKAARWELVAGIHLSAKVCQESRRGIVLYTPLREIYSDQSFDDYIATQTTAHDVMKRLGNVFDKHLEKLPREEKGVWKDALELLGKYTGSMQGRLNERLDEAA